MVLSVPRFRVQLPPRAVRRETAARRAAERSCCSVERQSPFKPGEPGDERVGLSRGHPGQRPGGGGVRPPAQTAVDDLGQRPADDPVVLARPGPRHEHDVPILPPQLRVDLAGFRPRAPVVQVAQVGPREHVARPRVRLIERATSRNRPDLCRLGDSFALGRWRRRQTSGADDR